MTWQLVALGSGTVVVADLEVADRWWPRFKGLQWRRGLAPGAGLLLVPCPAVHTHWMRFPIDVVLLDRSGVVLKVCREVRPWRIVAPVPGSYATLELPARSATLTEGERLRVRGPSRPASLAFLSEA